MQALWNDGYPEGRGHEGKWNQRTGCPKLLLVNNRLGDDRVWKTNLRTSSTGTSIGNMFSNATLDSMSLYNWAMTSLLFNRFYKIPGIWTGYPDMASVTSSSDTHRNRSSNHGTEYGVYILGLLCWVLVGIVAYKTNIVRVFGRFLYNRVCK